MRRLSLAELQREISALEALDHRTSDIDDLKSRFKHLFDGYACLTRVIDANYSYRTRKNETEHPYGDVSQVWYPKAGDVIRLGRVNRVGQSILYVSASHLTATLEARPQIGEIITVLRIKQRTGAPAVKVMELGVAEKQSQHKLKRTVRLAEETKFGQQQIRSKRGIPANLAIRSFLAREFTRAVQPGDEHQFKMTIAIAEFLLSSDRIDGLLYPSIAGDPTKWGGGQNLALKTDRADILFEPDHCWMIQVGGYSTGSEPGHIVRCLRNAKSIDKAGGIHW